MNIYDVIGHVILSSPFWSVVIYLQQKWFKKIVDRLDAHEKIFIRMDPESIKKDIDKLKKTQAMHEAKISDLFVFQQNGKTIRPS